MMMHEIKRGTYQHYKNKKLYEVIDIALHSETCEEMVVYRALYQSEQFGDHRIWVRPKKMFFEEVCYEGRMVARFDFVR